MNIQRASTNKIAEITALFWVAKIIATTLGETAGDFLAHTLHLGYIVGVGITGLLLVVILVAQIRSDRYRPALFWAAIVGTTTAGTEISDMMDRTLSAGYVLGSSILFAGLLATLTLWYARTRSLSVDPVAGKTSEVFFWVAVVFSNSLGTAFGDALIDAVGLTYLQGAFVCSAVIAAVLVLHYLVRANGVVLFWLAFVFTRPFGATFGDFLSKSRAQGGLELGTLQTSLVSLGLLVVVVLCSHRLERVRRTASGTV